MELLGFERFWRMAEFCATAPRVARRWHQLPVGTVESGAVAPGGAVWAKPYAVGLHTGRTQALRKCGSS